MPRPRKKKKSSQTPVIAGNWKMYKTVQEALDFIKTLAPLIQKSQATVYLAVSFTAIHPVAKLVEELKSPIAIGAQNMNDASEGAFTGEVAARMLKEAGARFVILGHSERRHLFAEASAFINKKVKRALLEDIQPIVCVGETLQERESGQMEAVLKKQLLESLQEVSTGAFEKIILAYEPVWAIGTGKVASPEDAEQAHQFCREVITETWGAEAGSQTAILYGGSVKPENAADLLARPGINGLLVGGASLSPESFAAIVNTYQVKPEVKTHKNSEIGS